MNYRANARTFSADEVEALLKDMQSTAQDLDVCKAVMRTQVRQYVSGELTDLRDCIDCLYTCLVDLDAMD